MKQFGWNLETAVDNDLNDPGVFESTSSSKVNAKEIEKLFLKYKGTSRGDNSGLVLSQLN